MMVNTKQIRPGEIDGCIRFKDNRNNKEPKGDPANFTSEISAGQKVLWFGVPEDDNSAQIDITGIHRKNDGPELIRDIGSDPGRKGVFIAQVIDEYTEGLESYSITFRINGHKVEYDVDPKLKMAR